MNLFDALMSNLSPPDMAPREFERFLRERLGADCSILDTGKRQRNAASAMSLRQAELVFAQCGNASEIGFPEAPGRLVVVMVASGSVEITPGVLVTCRRGDAYALAADTAWRLEVKPGSRLCVMTFAAADVRRVVERLTGRPPAGPLALSAGFRIGSAIGRMLAGLLAAVLAGMAEGAPLLRSALGARLLRDGMITLLLEQLPHGESAHILGDRDTAVPWQIRRAVEFIRSHPPGDIAVSDVAGAAEMSLRTLQQSFQRVLGATPQDYVKTVRLEAVRRELLDTASKRSIEEIASAWGFTNRGHFATQYRKMYGELPSQTRRLR
ncbi:AraC family transcriptional regulator [Bosea sp. (in: a-proteobacteria)]|uniref:AraC family transcriptional regulator n=1 Tax=Bosea sp. (in: a-proteobacteria) TaxID=1871050 RepID=UPI003B3AF160